MNPLRQRHARTPHRLWAGPIAMGLLTASGLVTALVSDTWGDWWSWVGLGIPTLAMGWFAWRPGRGARRPTGPGGGLDA